MAKELIEDIIAKRAFEQVERLNELLDKSVEKLNSNADAAKILEGALGGAKGLRDIKKTTEELAKANENLAKSQKEVATAAKSAKSASDLLREAEMRLISKAAATIGHEKKDSYKALEAQLKLATLAYKKLSEAERESAKGLDHVKRIDGLTTALKGMDAQMGNHQRNVGNYTGSFNALGNSINQLTREAPAFANSIQTGFMAISNNIPALFDAIKGIRAQNTALAAEGKPTTSVLKQLGGAIFSWGTALSVGVTLLTLYGKDIVEFAVACFKGTKALDAFTASQQSLNEALKGDEIKKNIADVQELKVNIDLAKEGFLDKDKVVKQYNETIGKTTGLVNDIDEAERALNKNAQTYVKVMLYKTAANLAMQKSAELMLESFNKRQDGPGAMDYAMSLGTKGISADDINTLKANKAARDAKAYQDGAAMLQKQAAKDAAAAGFNLFGDNDKDAKQAVKDAKEAERERKRLAAKAKRDANEAKREKERLQKEMEDRNKTINDAQKREYMEYLELQKVMLKNDEDKAKDIIDNENATLLEKLQANEAYYLAKVKLSQNEHAKETANSIATAEAQQSIQDKYDLQELDILRNKEIEKAKIIKASHEKEVAEALKNIDDAAVVFDEANSKEVQALQNAYIGGSISRQKYDKELAAIIRKSAIERLQIQLDEAQKALDIANLTADEKIAIQKRINALQKDLTSAQVDDVNESSFAKKLSADLEAYKAYQDAIIEIGSNIAGAVFDAELARLDAKDKRIQASYDLEKKAIENSTMSQVDKTKALAKLDAETALQKKKQEQERIKVERKKAIADKVGAALSIGLNTAIAVSKSIAESPLTFGLPWSAVVAALGASQLAVALAKPLPQYAKGRDGGGAEFAIVGEKGVEGIEGKDGSFRLTPNKASITYLKEGDKVIPHHKLMQTLEHKPLISASSSSTYDYDKIVSAQIESTKAIKELGSKLKTNISFYGNSSHINHTQISIR